MPERTPSAEGGLSGFWRRLLAESAFIREYLGRYRKFVAIGLLSLVLVDLLEVLPPVYLKESIDVVVQGRPVRFLALMALAYLVTAVLQGLGRYGWRMYLVRASLLTGRDLRSRYAHHLFRLSASFFEKRRVGDLMSLATNDVDAVRMMIGSGLLTFADALFYFMTVPVAMLWLSPKLTLLAFVPLPVIPWIVLRNEREIHERFEKVQESFGQLSALAQEGLTGIRVIKGFAKEDVQLRRFREAGEQYLKLNMDLARVQTAFGPTLDFTMSLGMVLLLYVGGRGLIFDAGTAVTLGTFVAFQRYIQKMVWPMAALGMAFNTYQRSITSSERLKEILGCASDVPDSPSPRLPEGVVPGGAWKTAGSVEMRDLRFRFPAASRDALSGINLEIRPGERIAFVGAVGAGKSALLALLPRIYPVMRGMLLIDGVDVNDWPVAELRRQLGYVSQDLFLFSETVSENVAFGLHEWIESDGMQGSIEEATRLAAVHEDVLELSGSYKTRLGERGVNLSGGQKQRLTIARALVKSPSILVLDDALASVDVQTEERILRGLRARPGRNTEIIAAHRISTIRDADRIVVLEGGTIRQVGTHAELVRDRCGLYRAFHEQQRLREDLEEYAASIGGESP